MYVLCIHRTSGVCICAMCGCVFCMFLVCVCFAINWINTQSQTCIHSSYIRVWVRVWEWAQNSRMNFFMYSQYFGWKPSASTTHWLDIYAWNWMATCPEYQMSFYFPAVLVCVLSYANYTHTHTCRASMVRFNLPVFYVADFVICAKCVLRYVCKNADYYTVTVT